ncbi:MAG: hypothetical protein AAFP15_20190, partial [Bacteroidota bacterium]
MVFLAHHSNLEIWAEDLSIRVFAESFGKKIIQLHFSERPPLLFIYDSQEYYEFDYSQLVVVKRLSCLDELGKLFVQKVNTQSLPFGEGVGLPYFGKMSWALEEVSRKKILSLKHFSFYSLQKCFETEQYSEHVEAFYSYFFSDKSNTRIWGQMNPLNLAIYHNDEVLLTRFLKQQALPHDKHGDFSVIEYSFQQGHPSLIKTLCDTLYQKD